MYSKMKRGLSIVGLVCASGAISAACLIDSEFNAVGVQADSGQGNYNCAVLTGVSGQPLTDLYAFGRADFRIEAGTVTWNVIPFEEDGILKNNPVYFVSTNSSGKGQRCNYLYDGTALDDAGLGSDQGSVNSVTICGDLSTTVAADVEQTDIITTEGDGCAASISYDAGTELPDVTIGFTSAVQGQTISVCGRTDSPESVALGLGQRECTPPPYVQTEALLGPDCFIDGSLTGEISLGCAPVDIDGAPLDGPEYCWYYENRVCEGTTADPGYCVGRTPGTFIPKSKKDTLNVQIDTFDGSTCYTYYLYGRAYFHCF